jgi:transcriptional regulator with XRE-family HTH domain
VPDQHSAGDARTAAAAARRDLGRLLADWRRRAGLTQRQLGTLTGYHHSVVAHSETGRPAAGSDFWKIADDVLGTGGTLAAGHHRTRDLEQAGRQQARRQQQAEREERVARALSRRRAPSAGTLIAGQAAAGCGVCPNCGQPFDLILRPSPEPGPTACS